MMEELLDRVGLDGERWSGVAWMAVALLLGGLGVYLLLRPTPLPVQVAVAGRGPMEVAVEEDGRTRVRSRYVVNAPVQGRYTPAGLEEGDSVSAGTPVARLEPLPLDPRAREQARARLAAARAGRDEAEAGAAQARERLEEARRRLGRIEEVAEAGGVSPEAVDELTTEVRIRELELRAARSRANAAVYEVRNARAALMASSPDSASGAGPLVLRSPAEGRVLEVHERSERMVSAGTPLVEVGDVTVLEVVVDVLSTDAVQVRPGDRMDLMAWGGDDTLRARVRRVEPSGFTRVSPLGIEEQRVNVVGDLLSDSPALGDRYRVEARIVIWRADSVLSVPLGAVFRDTDGWAVFRVEDRTARLREVGVGHRNARNAEILSGLSPGDSVVMYPDDRLEDGRRVTSDGG